MTVAKISLRIEVSEKTSRKELVRLANQAAHAVLNGRTLEGQLTVVHPRVHVITETMWPTFYYHVGDHVCQPDGCEATFDLDERR